MTSANTPSRHELAQRSEAFIKRCLREHLLPGTPVYLYGSRARTDHSWNSDFDIWVDADLPRATWRAVMDQLDESFAPFKVDIVATHQVAGNFGEQVKKEAALWM
jgi:predicted nucleotidyltransferase